MVIPKISDSLTTEDDSAHTTVRFKDEPSVILNPNQIKKRVLEHKLDIEDREFDTTWKSCCFQTDKRFVVFFSQFVISASIISFSMYQLVKSEDCNSTQLYSGLLSVILGFWLRANLIK